MCNGKKRSLKEEEKINGKGNNVALNEGAVQAIYDFCRGGIFCSSIKLFHWFLVILKIRRFFSFLVKNPMNELLLRICPLDSLRRFYPSAHQGLHLVPNSFLRIMLVKTHQSFKKCLSYVKNSIMFKTNFCFAIISKAGWARYSHNHTKFPFLMLKQICYWFSGQHTSKHFIIKIQSLN